MKLFSILITTKNRLEELKYTLQKINHLMDREDVECIVCDDGSTDGTSYFIETNYHTIQLIKNTKSKGLIFSRNRLLNLTKAKYAISLDDDAHILSKNPLENIEDFFETHKKCAVIAFRIFWGNNALENSGCDLKPKRVKGFVGCGHVWRMEAWREIPDYPDWFVFYGEEEFAAFQLFKKGWEIHYVPEILVQHRVDIKSRKNEKDYQIRLRRSLRSGWYLYFLFYPWREIPKRMTYTLWVQLKTKIFKGDFRALLAVLGATFDLIINTPKLISERNALTNLQYKEFKDLPDTVIYWQPSNQK